MHDADKSTGAAKERGITPRIAYAKPRIWPTRLDKVVATAPGSGKDLASEPTIMD
jgi:hypothetical protein